MPTVPTSPPPTRQVGVTLAADVLNALSAEAYRLTVERGRSVSVASVIRAAVGSYLTRCTRVQRVANQAPTSVAVGSA